MPLLDEIKQLSKLAVVEHDPEDQFQFERRPGIDSDDSDADPNQKDEYVSVTPGKFRRRDVNVLRDKKYAGVPVKRENVFSEDEASVSEESVDEAEDESEEDGDSATGDENGDVITCKSSDEEAGSDDDDEVVGSDDDDDADEDEEDESDEDGSDVEDDEEGYDILSGFFSSDKQTKPGETNGIKQFSESNESDEIKQGKAVRAQLAVWDSLMELRIQMQKMLLMANQCPRPEDFSSLSKLARKDKSLPLKRAKLGVQKIYGELVGIRDTMVKRYPEINKAITGQDKKKKNISDGDEDSDEEIPSDDEEIDSDLASSGDEAKVGKKRQLNKDASSSKIDDDDDEVAAKKFKMEDGLKATEEFDRKFRPYRNSVIEKWYQRTKLASGRMSNSKSVASGAVEQTPLQQIERILADRERLLERTRTKRSSYRILGRAAEVNGDSSGSNQDASAKVIEDDIYDDDDFYHQLLREVIERRTQNVSDPVALSRQWLEIQKLRSKMRRKVDTKASKGRKIRYDVMPKLVNFMAPFDTSTYTEQAINDLFQSLFGKMHQKDLLAELPTTGPSLFSNKV